MLELPEVLTVASQINEYLKNKTVSAVYPPTKVHKFCWFNGDPCDYEKKLKHSSIISAKGFGIYAEINFDNGRRLCFNDGVNTNEVPKKQQYQLLIAFSDNTFLIFTVAMYGGIIVHDGDYDNEYYLKNQRGISVFSNEFHDYYFKKLSSCKPTMTAKAFLATEQRFAGIGNGTAQDILFEAGINPKSKMSLLPDEKKQVLFDKLISVITDMTKNGGRDTQKDIFQNKGNYIVKMCKNTEACPNCGNKIIKEIYLGGSVYYCPSCQPLIK